MGQDLILPLPHPNNKPATPKQLEAQFKLGLLNNFLSHIDQLVNIGFKRYVKHNSPVNEAFSYNYEHAFVKDGEQYLINYPKMVYSRGHMVTPEGAQIASTEGKITFSWLPQNQSAYCLYTDLASFLIYNPATKRSFIFMDKVNRYSKTYVTEILADSIGETVHCYMSFRSADGKLNGDSCYIGETVISL